ncbi:hypothetical protein [Mycoplasmoides pirum]|uniref:hypothetical protein n=1 Tax=Mycoplasmoides pirum TaxID=2122 RepID=UPI0004877C40|nr:hypothetical protein [Mycoplasmoides pirum]
MWRLSCWKYFRRKKRISKLIDLGIDDLRNHFENKKCLYLGCPGSANPICQSIIYDSIKITYDKNKIYSFEYNVRCYENDEGVFKLKISSNLNDKKILRLFLQRLQLYKYIRCNSCRCTRGSFWEDPCNCCNNFLEYELKK